MQPKISEYLREIQVLLRTLSKFRFLGGKISLTNFAPMYETDRKTDNWYDLYCVIDLRFPARLLKYRYAATNKT